MEAKDMEMNDIEVNAEVQPADQKAPKLEKRSKLVADFCIAGFTYWNGLEVIDKLKVGKKIDMQVEDENDFDPKAVALLYKGKKLGYIPRRDNAQISQLLYFGHEIFVTRISQVNLEAHPEQQIRVVIRLKDARPPE